MQRVARNVASPRAASACGARCRRARRPALSRAMRSGEGAGTHSAMSASAHAASASSTIARTGVRVGRIRESGAQAGVALDAHFRAGGDEFLAGFRLSATRRSPARFPRDANCNRHSVLPSRLEPRRGPRAPMAHPSAARRRSGRSAMADGAAEALAHLPHGFVERRRSVPATRRPSATSAASCSARPTSTRRRGDSPAGSGPLSGLPTQPWRRRVRPARPAAQPFAGASSSLRSAMAGSSRGRRGRPRRAAGPCLLRPPRPAAAACEVCGGGRAARARRTGPRASLRTVFVQAAATGFGDRRLQRDQAIGHDGTATLRGHAVDDDQRIGECEHVGMLRRFAAIAQQGLQQVMLPVLDEEIGDSLRQRGLRQALGERRRRPAGAPAAGVPSRHGFGGAPYRHQVDALALLFEQPFEFFAGEGEDSRSSL